MEVHTKWSTSYRLKTVVSKLELDGCGKSQKTFLLVTVDNFNRLACCY